jgi:hypothetical protein
MSTPSRRARPDAGPPRGPQLDRAPRRVAVTALRPHPAARTTSARLAVWAFGIVVAAGLAAPPASAQTALGAAPADERPPELVVIAPEVVGLKPAAGADAWKVALAETEKRKGALGVSTALQKNAKAALAGPARDQAAECKGASPCLAELGSTLGARFVVFGTVEKDAVTWIIVDAATQKRVLGAKSGKRFASQGAKKQAEAAIRRAYEVFLEWRQGKHTEPEAGGVAMSPAGPEQTLRAGEAGIRVAAVELVGVERVEIDGREVPLAVAPDGPLFWVGAPGRHEVVATKRDRARARHDVVLEAGRVVDLVLVFLETAPPPPPPPPPPIVVATQPPPPEREGVTGKWWFWAAAGAAVVAGGTAAAVLVGGAKGGPQVGSSVGTITGSY